MKKKYLLFVFIFFPHLIFSQIAGNISIFDKVSVIQTVYFDIIYPEQCEFTAKNLAKHADEIYLHANDFLYITEKEKLDRIPVVLTDKSDILNGYFTTIPYSRIVLFDAQANNNLAVFDETILSVFYHEVIHAITIMQNQSGNGFVDTLGSFLTLAEMPDSMSEGTAVFAESFDGKGRLNNSFSTHVLRQAKIENLFPEFSEITGASELYTDGSLPYIFGGAFFDYLYKEYGIQKITSFWNNSVKFNFSGYIGSFKKIFGLSIDDAWKNFEESIPYPNINAVATPLLDGKHLYSNLTANDNGIVWQDKFTNEVYYLEHNSTKPKYLFITDLHDRLILSKNNDYLCISGTRGWLSNEKVTSIYDTKKWKRIDTIENIRDSAVISLPNISDITNDFFTFDTVVVGVNTAGQQSILEFYELDSKNSEPIKKIEFNIGDIVFDPVDCGDGKVVCLLYSNGTWNLFLYDTLNDEQCVYSFSQNALPNCINNLFASDNELFMSFAETKNSQPVLATLPIDSLGSVTIPLSIQESERSGGVFYPVIKNDTNDILHISRYYDSREISTFLYNEEEFYTYNLVKNEKELIEDFENTRVALTTSDNYYIETYNPFRYYDKGLFVPLVGGVTLLPIHQQLITPASLGASAFVLDPTEQLLVLAGGGYDFFKKKFNIAMSLAFADNYYTLNLDSSLSTSLTGLDIFAHQIQMGFMIPVFDNYNTFGILNGFRWFYLQNQEATLFPGHTIDNGITIYFQRLRLTSESRHSKFGFLLNARLQLEKYFGADDSKTNKTMFGTILKAGVWIPQLLPFNNPDRFTVNLPISGYFTKYFNFIVDWECGGDIVLLSYEIQKPDPYEYLFFNSITLDAGAKYVSFLDKTYDISVFGSLYLRAGINTGFFTKVPADIGLGIDWDPMKKGLESIELQFKFALNL